LKLETKEIDLLYYLIAGRLCLSVCNSAHSKKLNSDNAYISVSEKPAWALLRHWLEINPVHAQNEFRKAIGMKVQTQETVEQKVARRQRFISPHCIHQLRKSHLHGKSCLSIHVRWIRKTLFLDAYKQHTPCGACTSESRGGRSAANGQTEHQPPDMSMIYWRSIPRNYWPNSQPRSTRFSLSIQEALPVTWPSAWRDITQAVKNIMVMEHGYHGHTMTGIEISDYKFSNQKGPGQKPWILKTPIPDTYWGKHRGADAGKKLCHGGQ
jgi:ethanolamine-phosphate phospho-lyase